MNSYLHSRLKEGQKGEDNYNFKCFFKYKPGKVKRYFVHANQFPSNVRYSMQHVNTTR